MKSSTSWPMSAKLVNCICWAGPFAMIPLFQSAYAYLALLAIGAGNICTYCLIRKYSHVSHREQYLVGILSLMFIPLALFLNYTVLISTELAPLASRLLIAIAYGIGGIYALILDYQDQLIQNISDRLNRGNLKSSYLYTLSNSWNVHADCSYCGDLYQQHGAHKK